MSKINNQITNINWNLEPLNLYAPISYTLQSGGKRIRPRLVETAYRMFGGKDDKYTNVAIAIEIFHNFTLLHDDLMDNSPTRRNSPTVHKKWNANTAILSGDAMMIKAYEFIANTDEKHLKPVLELFNRTALEVCEGQQYDMDFEARDDVSIAEYFNMIRLKTAVLIATSLRMGAILADASKQNQQLIYDMGIAIGLAFQLKDDYLDTYGTFETLGKRIGDDILSQKKTYLLISTTDKLSATEKKFFYKILNDKKISNEDKIQKITNIFNSLKVPEMCKNQLDSYYQEANLLLDKIDVDTSSKEQLKQLINRLKIRES